MKIANVVNYSNYYHQPCQVSQCQMLLDVQLLGFQNGNNLETRYNIYGDIEYCCCDGSTCKPKKTANTCILSSCPESCDAFFNVQLSECDQYPSGCFTITTINEPITDCPSNFSSGYHFSFVQSNFSPQVSYCMFIYSCGKFWTLYVVHDLLTKHMWQRCCALFTLPYPILPYHSCLYCTCSKYNFHLMHHSWLRLSKVLHNITFQKSWVSKIHYRWNVIKCYNCARVYSFYTSTPWTVVYYTLSTRCICHTVLTRCTVYIQCWALFGLQYYTIYTIHVDLVKVCCSILRA